MNQHKLRTLGGALTLFFGGAYLIEQFMTPEEPATVAVDDAAIHIHVLSFNEAQFIEDTLTSLVEQPLYQSNDNIEIVVVDSHSTDDTREIASEYADDILLVDRGKLTARDQGIRTDENADIIVNTDADTIYPRYWLSHLLRPFADREVVAVSGPKLSRDPLYKPLRAWWSLLVENVSDHFPAPNSAFRRNAYLDSGGFDLSVDQMDRNGELNLEEEYRFRKKLEACGTVDWINTAVFSSERQQPVTLEDDDAVRKFRRERREGLRF